MNQILEVNPLFQENHLIDEQSFLSKKITSLENENGMFEKKKGDVSPYL